MHAGGASQVASATAIASSIPEQLEAQASSPPSALEFDICFVDPLPAECECLQCKQVLKYPVQVADCGHHVCSSCLPELLRVASKCPADQTTIDRDEVYVNKQLQKIIQALTIKCSYNAKGCTWNGRLRDIGAHIAVCDYYPISCLRGCGATFERRHQDAHLTSECDRRLIRCECLQEIKSEQRQLHLAACPKVLLECPNGCGIGLVKREKMDDHMVRECTKAGAACPFVDFGCEFKGERAALQNHVRDEPNRHLGCLCEGVIELKRLMMTFQPTMERLTIRLDYSALRIDALERFFGAQLLWKIDNFHRRFTDAKAGRKESIFSPPFLTGRHGYKMAVTACLYGDGRSRGKYLSLFVCLLQGENDALQSWPFAHRVTFTLLDQCQDPSAHRNVVYSIKPNTCKENRPFLARPTGERNACFGAQKFCDLSLLEKLDYVRDDVMFIMVQVDTAEMVRL